MNQNDITRHKFAMVFFCAELDVASQSLPDQNSLRTMLAIVDYLRHQQSPVSTERFAVCL